MVRICILRVGLVCVALLLTRATPELRAEDSTSVQQSIARAEAALRHRDYSRASRTLEEALKQFPGNIQLRLELGRVHVYQRQDSQALQVFQAILRDDPSNREAKLELARVLSYDKKYALANQLFRELLQRYHREPRFAGGTAI